MKYRIMKSARTGKFKVQTSTFGLLWETLRNRVGNLDCWADSKYDTYEDAVARRDQHNKIITKKIKSNWSIVK